MLVAAWIFYMVFDAYTTAKARMLGQPIPDHLGLNALLAGFGLGTTAAPVPATATAGAGPMAGSPMSSPDPGAVAVDPAMAAAQPTGSTAYADPLAPQRACGPGGMPLGAIILIALGVLLLLDNLGVLSFRWTAEFWPIVLIVIGIWLAVRRMGVMQGRS
jgi:hypothetical protein